MSEWPPPGYSTPKEWDSSKRSDALIALLVGIPLLAGFQSQLTQLADPLVGALRVAVSQTALEGWLLTGAWLGGRLTLTMLLCGSLAALCRWVIVPIHERIHYEAKRLQGQNPRYITQELFFFENPAVINLSTGITPRKDIPTTLAPLFIIGATALLATHVLNGFLEGLAAFVLVANSIASAGDLSNTIRVLLMPQGVQFANFEDGNEYKTEYVVPNEDS